ncbi:hypothetical protein BGAL_0060g00170 [Botrytis galanthina]|uniref:DUF6604 domain-containing protein n=1 Tax=Botrytis galanthina TaxID=278940 RepID=A0A4S8R548_9HELO|nr:hypothetical protein BGAL_0060g00170 [Botrytis galanthina]
MAQQFPIFDTWKSYKELEKRFLRWLVKTASAIEQDLESPGSTPRLEYIKRLTEVVISEKHELPSNVRDDLAQVISKRKEAAEWYGRNNQADQGHRHYLETLQMILQLFEDLYSGDPNVALDDETNGKSQIDSETTNDEGVTNNLFGSLEIESTNLSSSDSHSDGERNSAGGSARNYRNPKRNKKGKNAKNPNSGKIRKNEIEIPIEEQTTPLETEDSDPFDEYMRVYFFLKGIRTVRTYLLEQWCDYSIELLSLANVSLVTNQAMATLQWSEKILLSHLPSDKQSYESIANIICPDVNDLMEKIKKAGATDFSELLHFNDESKDSQEHNDAVKTEVSASHYQLCKVFHIYTLGNLEKTDHLCYTTWSILSEWGREFSVKQYQEIPDHRFVAPEDNKKFTLENKIDLNRNILHELLYEVCYLKKEMDINEWRNYYEDEFTKGIQKFLDTKEIPIWLVFAAQIMCDIRFILGKEVVHCHDEVVLFSSHMLRLLGKYIRTTSTHQLHNVDRKTRALYDDLLIYNLRDWMSLTFVPHSADGEKHPTPISKTNHEKFSYLRRNPIMCGLLIFANTIKYNEAGVLNTAAEPSTISCIHLYNALRQESRKDLDEYPEWKDMEFLILIQSVDQLFNQSDAPSNSNDYVVSFGKKIRKRGPKALGLQHISGLAKYFHRTYCTVRLCDHHGYSSDSRNLVVAIHNDKLDELLPNLKNIFPGDRLSPPPSDEVPSNFSNCIEDLNDRLELEFLAKHPNNWNKVEFFRAMTRLMEKEALFLYFDLHGIFVTCTHMIKNLHEEFRSEIDGAACGISLFPEPSDAEKVAHLLLKWLGKSEEVRKDTVKRMRKVFDRRLSKGSSWSEEDEHLVIRAAKGLQKVFDRILNRNLSGSEEDEHLVIRAVNLFLIKRPRHEVSKVEMELSREWPRMRYKQPGASDTFQRAEAPLELYYE